VKWFTSKQESGRNAAFLFERQRLTMFYADDKYKADVVDQCEDALIEYFGYSALPDEQEVWEYARNFSEPPNIQNVNAELVFCAYINYAVEEFGADREDFSYFINGSLDTSLIYQDEMIDDPSELYYELQEKHQQRQIEGSFERAYD
jgi:hypothetical protein